MGGRRVAALVMATALALAGCAVADSAPGVGAVVPGTGDSPPLTVVEAEPAPDSDVGQEATGGGELAWAGYDPAYGAPSSQVLASATAGVAYLVRAVCVSEAPVDLWFEVSVDQVPTAEGSFACTGTELVTALGQLPDGAVVTVDLTGDVELTTAASVLVFAADG
jgi:hypothetical protein